jgi:hypothetical protein
MLVLSLVLLMMAVVLLLLMTMSAVGSERPRSDKSHYNGCQ